MEFDIPFVVIESAPRKRGKTTFNLALLPLVEKSFDHIHIFCPSIQFQPEYYDQFHENPKYHLYSENLYGELEKVIAAQKAAVRRAALDKRRADKRDKERKKHAEKRAEVVFKPARVNGRKQRAKKGRFNIIVGNEFIVEYPKNLVKYSMLLPDIFAGNPGQFQSQQLAAARTHDPKGPQILIVMDDCIGEGLFDGGGLAQELASRGRHFNTSLIASTQQLTKVDIVIRNNADYWLFWLPHSIQELESFIEKFVSKNYVRIIRDMVQESYQGDHDFIFYNPHALKWTDRFTVGDMQAFFKDKMRKVFTDDFKLYFYPVVTNE